MHKKEITNFEYMVDMFIEYMTTDGNKEEVFYCYDTLSNLADEMKEHFDDILAYIGYQQDKMYETCIDEGVCPYCGGSMEYVSNGEDTYVPYGSTYVKESEGADLICEDCGFNPED